MPRHNSVDDAERQRRLARANEIRSFRRLVKEDLAAGHRELADVLIDPAPELATMKVGAVLPALPGIGLVQARKLLGRANVGYDRQLGNLTDRERGALLRSRQTFGRYARAAA